MRNFVAKHDYNRASTHTSAKDYVRKWDLEEELLDEGILEQDELEEEPY